MCYAAERLLKGYKHNKKCKQMHTFFVVAILTENNCRNRYLTNVKSLKPKTRREGVLKLFVTVILSKVIFQ